MFVPIPSNLYGEVWPADLLDVPANADDWLISLRSLLPEEHAEAVVAHEIAPGWLGPDRMDPKTGLELEEAVELVGG